MAKSRVKKYQLSVDGIKLLVSDLEAYKGRLLKKSEQLLKELSKRGIKTAKERIQGTEGDSDKHVRVEVSNITYAGNNVIMTISASGEDILFIEFGAGIFYNGGRDMLGKSPHPWGEKMGYAIGKYPKGRTDYSLGRLNQWTHDGIPSQGTKASMPMLGAMETIYTELHEACEKVFK